MVNRSGIRKWIAQIADSQRSARAYLDLLYSRFIELPRNVKQSLLLALDMLAIPVAMYIGMALRLGRTDFHLGVTEYLVCITTMLVSAVVFLRLGLYRAIVRFMGHEAIVAIVKAVTLSTLALAVLVLVTRVFIPRSLLFIYWSLLLICVGGSRLLVRAYGRQYGFGDRRRIAIYGAGMAGRQLLTALQCGVEFEVVLFVDDNRALQGSVINGVPVASPVDLPELIQKKRIGEVLLAIASLSNQRRREIIRSLADQAIQVRTIPGLEDLVRGRANISEVREISLEDLLGREPVPPQPELLARCIAGKSVLVTGAGGSIGGELCRQIITESPRFLILLESSEFALYEIQRELESLALRRGCRTRIVALLGSVRDAAHLRRIMQAFRVETLYHAAAYKHVPLVEYNVVEGVRNNLLGTLVTATVAAECGVETFVLISTDKAVRPANIMGASKRVAEMILQGMAHESGRYSTRFVIVRFGNVIGSSGSAIPLFREQILQGGPVTVTHEDVNRYFMTVSEAALLVLHAGAMGSGGDVFVLNMGEPIRIIDLARRMVQLSGLEVRDAENPDGDIEISITGLRTGEKLNEELLMGDEVSSTGHPMILRAREEFLPWKDLAESLLEFERACEAYDCARVLELFAHTVRGFDARYGCSDLLAEQMRLIDARTAPRIELLQRGKSR
jgi:FlaA1/EpsC-like NDP-sugar epimerase